MDEFNAFVGGLSGVFKGLRVSNGKGIKNVTNLQKLKEIEERSVVTCLNWADKLETEIIIGYDNKLVKIYDLNKKSFVFSEKNELGDGPICGVFKLNGSLVTAVGSGVVKVWREKGPVIETSGPLNRMRQNPCEENIIGTGGKENDLKLWDLETEKATFQAKNVRHDELELRVPVWVMDLAFIPNSKQVAVATRHGHVRLYDPSTPTRRPVCQVTVKDHSFTCIAVAPQDKHVVVGCTTGNMYLVDLRGKGLLLNKYKGFMGSVRQVMCPTHEPYIVSVSLDRHLRIHHLNTKKLLFKEYMQSRLSALLLKSSFTMEDVKEESSEVNEWEEIHDVENDEEYELLEEDMEEITNSEAKITKNTNPTSKKKSTDESDEEYEKLFDEMEVISEKPKITEKRQKSILSKKSKRLKSQNPEIVVGK